MNIKNNKIFIYELMSGFIATLLLLLTLFFSYTSGWFSIMMFPLSFTMFGMIFLIFDYNIRHSKIKKYIINYFSVFRPLDNIYLKEPDEKQLYKQVGYRYLLDNDVVEVYICDYGLSVNYYVLNTEHQKI